ncbi:MAG: hypothetical protein AAF215_35425 [Cyanobacteria bacterium P01_A01_bin.123]
MVVDVALGCLVLGRDKDIGDHAKFVELTYPASLETVEVKKGDIREPRFGIDFDFFEWIILSDVGFRLWVQMLASYQKQ